MTNDEAETDKSGLCNEPLPSAAPSTTRADVPFDPELQRWLDEAETTRKPRPSYSFFLEFGDALPYIIAMLGVLAFALLAGWAMQNLP